MSEQDDAPATTARPRRPANRLANSRPQAQLPPAVQMKNVTTAVSPDKVGLTETKKLLESKIEAIRRVIPKGVQLTAEGLVQNALLQMETAKDRKIKLCTPRSILYAVMAAAHAGLDLIGEQAFLVAMSKKRMEGGAPQHDHYYCSLWPGYRGLCTIASRFGWFLDVQDVRANDGIVIDLGSNLITHHMKFGQRGDLVGTYCAVRRMTDGRIFHIEPMDKTEIDALSQDTDAWKYAYQFMAKKSVCKRGFKWIPKDRADARIIEEVERRNDANEELDGLTASPATTATNAAEASNGDDTVI